MFFFFSKASSKSSFQFKLEVLKLPENQKLELFQKQALRALPSSCSCPRAWRRWEFHPSWEFQTCPGKNLPRGREFSPKPQLNSEEIHSTNLILPGSGSLRSVPGRRSVSKSSSKSVQIPDKVWKEENPNSRVQPCKERTFPTTPRPMLLPGTGIKSSAWLEAKKTCLTWIWNFH